MSVLELMEDIDGMREHVGMTVQELAQKAHISPKTYRDWVEGHSMPNLWTLNEVLDALGIALIPVYQETML